MHAMGGVWENGADRRGSVLNTVSYAMYVH